MHFKTPFQSATPPSPSSASLARFVDLAFRDRTRSAPAPEPARDVVPLLTHHQIVEMAAPFARRGRALDLAASDRLHRRLVFHSVPHAAASRPCADGASEPGTLQDSLQLDSPRPGYFRLTRTLCDDDGLQATLRAEGESPRDLLASVEAMPPQWQFHAGPGYRMARSGLIGAVGAADAGFRLTHARMRGDAFSMSVSVSGPASSATTAAVQIEPRGAADALPADLLAVLGWDWSLLHKGLNGWTASIRLRTGAGPCENDADHKLRVTAAHLARALAECPLRFHGRLLAARWGVFIRHAIPLLTVALLGAGALFADELRNARASPWPLLLLSVPPTLLLLFLLRSERPELGLPVWPRPPATHAWEVTP